MTLEYWYMMPISVIIATVAMASGVEGATFFAPLFMLGLGLPADVAIGVGLITEVFGFASGLFAYIRRSLIDYRLALGLLVVAVPAALAGTLAAGAVPGEILKSILGVGLFAVALSFLRAPKAEEARQLDQQIGRESPPDQAGTCLTTRDGTRICYTVCNKAEGTITAGVGGLFIGMISTGLGEMNGYYLLQRCRVPSQVAVATSVFIVSVTAFVASAGHAVRLVQRGDEVLATVISLTVFTIPGVVIGGQVGPLVASRLSQGVLERALGGLFILVGLLMLVQVALSAM